MTPVRILLVEDDSRFARVLGAALRRVGYEIDHATTAQAALAAGHSDLVLLDLGLPDGDGTDVCRQLRARSEVGIILLTARGEERDRVIGLRCGADDYVVKPFGFAELQARMEAVLRRARPRPTGVQTIGRLTVDLDRHQVLVDDDPITLTRKEFQLLAMLVRQPGNVIRRDRLMMDVWHTTWRGTSRTLDVHMTTLRSKLGDAADIETVRGVGYRFLVVQASNSEL
jgi:DNA-binding response OmpR family regulator